MKFLEHFRSKIFAASSDEPAFSVVEIVEFLEQVDPTMCVHELIDELKSTPAILAPSSPAGASENSAGAETTTSPDVASTEPAEAPGGISITDVVPSNVAGEPILHEADPSE